MSADMGWSDDDEWMAACGVCDGDVFTAEASSDMSAVASADHLNGIHPEAQLQALTLAVETTPSLESMSLEMTGVGQLKGTQALVTGIEDAVESIGQCDLDDSETPFIPLNFDKEVVRRSDEFTELYELMQESKLKFDTQAEGAKEDANLVRPEVSKFLKLPHRN